MKLKLMKMCTPPFMANKMSSSVSISISSSLTILVLNLYFLHLQFELVSAKPSFLEALPNAYFVPCSSHLPGCSSDSDDGSRDAAREYCLGLGHQDCRGGLKNRLLNKFGIGFIINEFKWTKQLCESDSDGDGYTNGEELGDPCCTWVKGSKSTDRHVRWPVSHPGYSQDTPVSEGRGAQTDAYAPPKPDGGTASERWQCEVNDETPVQGTNYRVYNDGEPRLRKDLNIT